MFTFDFTCETISFAFLELDLELGEDDFEKLLLDFEDFSEHSSQYNWIFDTKSIILEFSLK